MYLDCLDKLKYNLECCKSKLCSKCCEDKKEKLFTITYEFDDFTIPPIVDESDENGINTKYFGNEIPVKIYVESDDNICEFNGTMNTSIFAMTENTGEVNHSFPLITIDDKGNFYCNNNNYFNVQKKLKKMEFAGENLLSEGIEKQNNPDLDSYSTVPTDNVNRSEINVKDP